MDEKHRAILNISFEIHPLSKNGECNGHIVPASKLKEYDLKSKRLYKLDGENLNFLLSKLKEILNNFQ